MRRKEYAASLGLANEGRGRMSREALAAIEKARAEGMVFDDDAPAPVKSSKPATVKVERKRETRPVVAVETGQIMADTILRYPMDQKFVGVDSNGKSHTVGAASACYNCGYSLCGHTCNEPMALIGSPLEWIAVTPK